MRNNSDPALEAAANEALSDPTSADTSYELRLGGVPVVPREIRYTAEDVREQDAPAMKLDLTLPGSWPDSLEGQDAHVDVTVGGAIYAEFRGTVMWIEALEDGDTKIEAYSTSTWLAEDENGKETTWAGTNPRRAMQETVSGLRYSRLDLSAIPTTPELYRESSQIFEVDGKRSERLEDLRTQAQVTFFDGPDGTGTGATLGSLSVPGNPVRTYTVGREVKTLTTTPKFKGRYSAVVVRRDLPSGEKETVRRIEIDNQGVYVPENVVYPVDITDTTPEGLARALDTGSQAAKALTYGAWEFNVDMLILDPRIVRVDTLAFEETKREGRPGFEADVTRLWLGVVAGYERDPQKKEAKEFGACLKVSEVVVLVDAEESQLASAGVSQAPFGLDYMARLYFSDEWSYPDPQGLVIDATEAERQGVTVTLSLTNGLTILDG